MYCAFCCTYGCQIQLKKIRHNVIKRIMFGLVNNLGDIYWYDHLFFKVELAISPYSDF